MYIYVYIYIYIYLSGKKDSWLSEFHYRAAVSAYARKM